MSFQTPPISPDIVTSCLVALNPSARAFQRDQLASMSTRSSSGLLGDLRAAPLSLGGSFFHGFTFAHTPTIDASCITISVTAHIILRSALTHPVPPAYRNTLGLYLTCELSFTLATCRHNGSDQRAERCTSKHYQRREAGQAAGATGQPVSPSPFRGMARAHLWCLGTVSFQDW